MGEGTSPPSSCHHKLMLSAKQDEGSKASIIACIKVLFDRAAADSPPSRKIPAGSAGSYFLFV